MANEDDTTKSSPSKPRLVRSNTFDLLCSALNRDDDDEHTTSNTNLESQNPAKSTTNLTKSKTRTVKASQSTGEVGSPRKTSRAKSAKASTLNHRIAWVGNDNSSTTNGTTSDYDNREARGFMFVNMSHLPAQEEPEVNSSSRQSESRAETGLIFYDLKPSSNVNSSKGKTRMLLDSNPLKQNGTLSVAENSGDTLVFVVSDNRIAENREQLMASRMEDEDNEDQSSTSTLR